MRIIDTFVVVEDALISVQYEDYDTHEFEKVFDFFQDPLELFNFFEENKGDLEEGFAIKTVREAVEFTRKEALKFERTILKYAEDGKEDGLNTLSDLFEPLSNKELNPHGLERDKAHGSRRNNWLRIYAIRIGINQFVISGGTIKLTQKMHDREHTRKELEKLDLTKHYLEENEIDIDNFFESK